MQQNERDASKPTVRRSARRLLITATLTASALLLGACGGDSSSSTFSLRVIHASPDAPQVNVLVDDDPILTQVDYKQGSGFERLKTGTYDLRVDAITPAGDVPVIPVPGFSFDPNTEYSVLAIGKVGDNTLQPLVIANPRSAVSAGQARVQVVHAAPVAPTGVVVYVTAPGAVIDGNTPALGTFDFGQNLGPVEVPAGSYQIRATLTGSLVPVYDSGTVALPAGADLLVVAVNNTTNGPSPVSLLVNDGSTQSELLDVGTQAGVRAGHFSPDTPAVDVIVNDNLGAPLFGGVTFPALSAYAGVAPDTYNIKVVDTATQGITAINANLTLDAGERYTVLAVNVFNAIEPLVLTDERRSIATEAQVRIIHGSSSAGPVDIYVTAPGVDISDAGVTPTFANVPFKADTGYVALTGGTYDVSVTPQGLKSPVAIFATLPAPAGSVQTVIARDGISGGPLGVVLADDTL